MYYFSSLCEQQRNGQRISKHTCMWVTNKSINHQGLWGCTHSLVDPWHLRYWFSIIAAVAIKLSRCKQSKGTTLLSYRTYKKTEMLVYFTDRKFPGSLPIMQQLVTKSLSIDGNQTGEQLSRIAHTFILVKVYPCTWAMDGST